MKTLNKKVTVLTPLQDNYGSSWRIGAISTTYNNLFNLLGEPTYNDNSGDGKVSKEWALLLEGNYYTIYDYKYYDGWKNNEVIEWSIGGTKDPYLLIDYLNDNL